MQATSGFDSSLPFDERSNDQGQNLQSSFISVNSLEQKFLEIFLRMFVQAKFVGKLEGFAPVTHAVRGAKHVLRAPEISPASSISHGTCWSREFVSARPDSEESFVCFLAKELNALNG